MLCAAKHQGKSPATILVLSRQLQSGPLIKVTHSEQNNYIVSLGHGVLDIFAILESYYAINQKLI